MSDSVSPVDASVQTVAQDVVDAAVLGKKVLAAYKSGGASAATALLGDVVTAVEKDYADVKAALPSIKAGYKTTEFWLVVGVFVGNGLYTAFSGKALPIQVNAIVAGVTAIYIAARALTKSSPAAASTPAAK